MQLRDVVTVLILTAAVGCHRKPARRAVEDLTLPDGLRVELVPGRCGDGATVAVRFSVGSDHDPAGRSGLAHVVERALAQRSRTVEAGTDHTAYAASAAADRVGDTLAAIAAEMTKLELTTAELERARADVLADLAARHGGDPALTAASYAAESVQPTPGEGWRGGIASEVEAITAADVEAFWRAHYQPGNARVVVIGDVDPKAVRDRLAQAFAPLPGGSPPARRAPVAATVTGTLVMGDAPAAVAIAVPAPAPASPQYPAFLILAARPTSGAGRLDYDPIARPETLFVTGAVQAGERPEAAAARIRAELDALLARPLAAGDVAAARARFAVLLGGRELDAATCAKDPRAYAFARARRAQLQLDGAALATALAATTPAQLAEAAALFDAKRTAAVIAGGAIR